MGATFLTESFSSIFEEIDSHPFEDQEGGIEIVFWYEGRGQPADNRNSTFVF